MPTAEDLVRRTNVPMRIGRPKGRCDVPRFAGQIKVCKVEVSIRTSNTTTRRLWLPFHSREHILEAFENSRDYHVERRIIEGNPAVRRRFLDRRFRAPGLC
jgi:hypothetical protein